MAWLIRSRFKNSTFSESFVALWSLPIEWKAVRFVFSYFQCLSLSGLRSNRPDVFCKKGVLRNFAKFRGKHLGRNLFFNKVAGLRPATLFKKRLWHRCFPMNFVKFPRATFFTEHLRATASEEYNWTFNEMIGPK